MKITVGQLRKLISEQLDQMKLGIASANPPAEAYGPENEPEPAAVAPADDGYIAMDFLDFDPGEEVKTRYRGPKRDAPSDPFMDPPV